MQKKRGKEKGFGPLLIWRADGCLEKGPNTAVGLPPKNVQSPLDRRPRAMRAGAYVAAHAREGPIRIREQSGVIAPAALIRPTSAN